MNAPARTHHIYLCAAFGRQAEMRHYRTTLQRDGYTVTSRWIDMPAVAPTDPAAQGDIAEVCLIDVARADALIAYTEPVGSAYFTGGRHVEVGIALAWGMPVYVIGPVENVFHCHPRVTRCTDLVEARGLLTQLTPAIRRS